MLRASLLLVTSLATTTAAAATPDELPSTLQRAVDAASTGRCDEALVITREIAAADSAFYAAHVPIQPAIAACVRARIARPAPAPATSGAPGATSPSARTDRHDNDDGGVVGPLLLGGAAGVAGWIGAGLLVNKIANGRSNGGGDDEGGPSNGFVIAASLGGIVASSAMVYLASGDSRHESSLAATVTGSVVGGAVGALVGYPMIFDSSPWLGLGIVVLSPAIGATIGYQVAKTTKKRMPVEIVPTVAGGQFGASIGGSF